MPRNSLTALKSDELAYPPDESGGLRLPTYYCQLASCDLHFVEVISQKTDTCPHLSVTKHSTIQITLKELNVRLPESFTKSK